MSLVTPATESEAPSVRQSAATRAVLPEPTGPPMPIRTGPSPCARCGWESPSSSSLWSGGKVPRPSGGVLLGEEVEQGIGVRGRDRVRDGHGGERVDGGGQ